MSDQEVQQLKHQLAQLKAKLEEEEKKADEAKAATDEAKTELKKVMEEAKQNSGKPIYIAPGKRLEVFHGIFSDPPEIARDWVEDARNHLALRPMSKSEEATCIRDHLRGNARKEILGRGPDVVNNPDLILRTILKVFGGGDALPVLQQKFFSYRQKTGESLLECSLELIGLYDQISKLDAAFVGCRKSALKGRLAEAVHDEGLQRELRRLNIEAAELSFFDLRDRAIDWIGSRRTPQEATVKEMKVDQSQSKILELLQKQCAQLDAQQQQINDLLKPRKRDRRCYSCNKVGHLARDCRQKKEQAPHAQQQQLNF